MGKVNVEFLRAEVTIDVRIWCCNNIREHTQCVHFTLEGDVDCITGIPLY